MIDPRVRGNPVALIWLGGAVLAVLLYLTGPENFVHSALSGLSWATLTIETLLANVISQAFDAVRAAAVALFVVFLVLGAMAIRRGLRPRGTIVIISVLYLFLLWPSLDYGYVSSDRWFAAFLLAGIGSLLMTRRLSRGAAVVPAGRPAPDWR